MGVFTVEDPDDGIRVPVEIDENAPRVQVLIDRPCGARLVVAILG